MTSKRGGGNHQNVSGPPPHMGGRKNLEKSLPPQLWGEVFHHPPVRVGGGKKKISFPPTMRGEFSIIPQFVWGERKKQLPRRRRKILETSTRSEAKFPPEAGNFGDKH